MSRLDYENARRYTKPSDCTYDDLPRAGSWADRKRYLFGDANHELRTDTRSRHSGRQANTYSNLEQDIAQLEAYVRHAEHRDFSRKAQVQKAEVISIIRKLLHRPSIQGLNRANALARIRGRAIDVVARHSH